MLPIQADLFSALANRARSNEVLRHIHRWVMRGLSHNFILITGCQRSGTTLLLLMIDAHPKIHGQDESEVGHRLPSAREILSDLRRGSVTCWKQPEESGALDRICQQYTNLRVIWMIRNPLAVVSSMRRLQMDDWDDNWLGMYADNELDQLSRIYGEDILECKNISNVKLGGKIWRLNMGDVERFEERGLSVIRVRFEDFMNEPKKELTRIADGFGFSYSRKMISFHKKEENKNRVLAGGTKGYRKLDPDRATPKIDLTEQEREEVIDETMPWISKLGYL